MEEVMFTEEEIDVFRSIPDAEQILFDILTDEILKEYIKENGCTPEEHMLKIIQYYKQERNK